MKLMDIPSGSKIYADISDGSTYLIFHRTDGLYSYCETELGGVAHLHIATPLVQHGDGYRIKEMKDGT